MGRSKKLEQQIVLLNQDKKNSKPKRPKKDKLAFLNHSLLLKQTLLSAWKSKLQLVILLLLTAFATSLVTGSWISYKRVQQGEIFLELDKAKYDAVLPYNTSVTDSTQIANEAFSLRVGRLFYQSGQENRAVYFDNSIIGQEINPLSSGDLKIVYTKEGNKITGISGFAWSNPNQPLTFNRGNRYVKASVYGQLLAKTDQAQQANDMALANYYQTAAQDLYQSLFVNVSANQILESLRLYFVEWIQANATDPKLTTAFDDDFTNFLITERINYHGTGAADFRIPDTVNIAQDINDPQGVLATKLLKLDDTDPRLAGSTVNNNYGMNGQWMKIYRNFDITPKPTDTILSDFTKSYRSPSNYNNIVDSTEPNMYSYHFAQAAAALQNRNINVVNQFVASAGVDEKTGQSVSVKVVNLGLKSNHNNVNLKIFEGLYPSTKNEIAISPQYARQKHIKPGDSINIDNQIFMVSGIGGDAYNIYPTINSLDPVPNTRTEFIAYVLPDTFYAGTWNSSNKTDISLMYFLPWKDVSIPKFDISYFDDYFQKALFNNNKINDRNQYDYLQYLIEKYNNNNADYQSKYQIDANLVVTEDNSQFATYNRGLSVLESTLNGFKYAAIGGVVFLVIIVIFITYLIIKKAIQKDQVSMGILKSAGYSTNKILVSYIAYPILVALFAIPIGWLVGLVFQVYFTELFNTIFILPYNAFSFNIIPLFIALALIGGFVLITTLLAGFHLLQRQPLSLINNDSDIKLGGSYIHRVAKPTPKLGFKGRFLLSLSRTNWKKITITAVVISIATLAITATVSIPATISGMKDNYFKTQKYKNYYQYQSPIPNMPLSKYGLYAWNNLDNSHNEDYYPVASTMPWPEDIIINDAGGEKLAWYNPLDYEKTGTTSNFANILHSFPGKESSHATIVSEVGGYLDNITNGPLDLNFLSWCYSWLGGRGFSNALLTDLAKADKSLDKNFSTSLINFASTLLPGLLNVTNPGIPPGPDAIKEILKLTLPGFIRQVLDRQGPNAYDYFSIGHSTVAYNPLYNNEVDGPEEELVTQLQLGSTDSKLDNEFLDISGIDPNTKMLVIKPNLVQGLKYRSYDNVIPMVINQSFAAKYNLGAGQTIDAAPNVRTLYYQTNNGVLKPLPKANWYYGSTPPAGSNPDNKLLWNAHASRWNYRGQQQIAGTQFKDSYGYSYDGFYDNNGSPILKKEPEPWNNVENIWLQLPSDINSNALNGTLRNFDKSENLQFDTKNIASDGLGNNWIKPFSYKIANDYKDNEINPTNLLTTRIPEWYGAMLDKEILVSDTSLHLDSLQNEITNKLPEWWTSIVGDSQPITKYRIIGIQNSYDTPRAYIDQKWANLIAGYSYYDDRSELKDPVYNNGVYQWFSGKLSAADNIYDIIGRMSFKRTADDYTMYSMSNLDGNGQEPLVANSDLLSRKRDMLNKMADVAALGSALFIVTTILCSILIVIMITDAFLEQFRRFMSQMKAEGYTNQEINSFTLGIFTPWVFLGYAAGYGLGYLIVWGFTRLIATLTGLALPFTFIWWIIPVSFAIIALIYFSTFIINTVQLNKMNLIALLQN